MHLPAPARMWRIGFAALAIAALVLLARVSSSRCIPAFGWWSVRHSQTSQQIDSLVREWEPRTGCDPQRTMVALRRSIVLHYQAIPVYVATLILGCLLAVGVFRRGERKPLVVIGVALVLLSLVAGAIDVVGNISAGAVLSGSGGDAESVRAFWAPIIALVISGLALLFIVVGAGTWRPAPAAQGRANEPDKSPNEPPFLAATFADEWLAIHWRRQPFDATVAPDDPQFQRLRGLEQPPAAGAAMEVRRSSTEHPSVTLGGHNAEPNDAEAAQFPAVDAPPEGLFGLALSGGGIRSATFALGVLQRLELGGVLRWVDYLSTVSGGGFTGGWWSAWLSRPRPNDPPLTEPPPAKAFPNPEEIEPERYPPRVLATATQAGTGESPLALGGLPVPEGSLSVQRDDPIHHLRLFANYLTPRKGILSADTWRAITIVSRNLVLTWLVLVPLFFAAIVLVQLYYVSESGTGFGFICSRPDATVVNTAAPTGATSSDTVRGVAVPAELRARWRPIATCDSARVSRAFVSDSLHSVVLSKRAHAALRPLAAFVIVAVALTLLWMLTSEGGIALTLTGIVALLAMSVLLVIGYVRRGPTVQLRSPGGFLSDRVTVLWVGVTIAVVLAAIVYLIVGRTRRPRSPDRLRNRLAHFHAVVLAVMAVVAVALLLAGFGHEVVWWLFGKSGVVASAGGWSALAATVGSAVYTALKTAPSSKDETRVSKPSKLNQIIFFIAPILVLVGLGVGLASLGHWLIGVGSARAFAMYLGIAVLVGAALEIVLGVNELWERVVDSTDVAQRRDWLVSLLVAGVIAALATMFGAQRVIALPRGVGLGIVAAVLALLAFRLVTTREALEGDALGVLRVRGAPSDDPAERGRDKVDALIITILFGAAAVVAVLCFVLADGAAPDGLGALTKLALGALTFVGLLVVVDLWLGKGNSERATALFTIAAVSCAALVLVQHVPYDPANPQSSFARAGLGVAAVAVAWVIGLGWAVDPNLVSLHTFYRARLVRAYLGASNRDERRNQDITESATGDDMKLTRVLNHWRGGPYHLVNTTLNLVGGRDLTTAQRSAANFVLSKYLCGSSRTGFCRTDEYMSGRLTLGTAVAISGAAVSPTMGSATPSAALAMLLALLNVRIGFWAPTPNRKRWREVQPRLWPFYLLRESLSQTNDLGTYCYLTDGGHFDNTGVYSLVERGCKLIMIVDDGADPGFCFADIGQVVRRCRIDFGADIALPGETFLSARDGGLATKHFARGTITYSDAHLKQLGYADEELAAHRTGVVVWVKPVVSATDSIDVRQYRMQNDSFPQQTTADQWFDEAQFESYRKLGEVTAESLVGALCFTQTPPANRAVLVDRFGAL